jgi:DNA polymerase-1
LNTVDVYDIQVEDYHNFIANEICVHNSDSPNFQNMPVRDKELAQLVRSCIIPRSPKNHIVEVDYSGAEVKCAAAYHKDSRMLEYLSDNTTDMHRDMAAQCFMLPPEKITKPMRNISKGYFVFASFYGSWWVSLAMNIWRHLQIDNVTTEDGVLVIDHLKSQGITGLGEVIDGKPTPNSFYAHIKDVEFDFWNNRFSEYNQWKKQAWNNYLKNGYIDFLSGFRCAGVFSRNEVLNMPIQGLSFHCLLWSLIQVNNELKKRKMKTLLIGQIHDSIVADSPENETDRFLELVHEMMVERLHKHWKFLVARMEVEADVAPLGCSWFDKKPYAITK